ncbi:nadh-ubiquinone oxidoreductase 39 kda [Colletotrichum musicola]|uniref:Protein-lysine N-methyltransferase EFM5 n=1 Tax=Colletotrichum musicola TaxID=2175873 RepID=A0A8H6U5L4_9PEZI|nr:nadh-ubiquinone oxidoreductase 39 kda [Colletotrichum musicola]
MASIPTAMRSTHKVAHSAIRRQPLHDIAITRTGKPILRTQGGRHSLGGHTATVFGATGQVGRYIVNRLGCTVVIPFREEMAKRHLKVAGDLGRVVFMEYDLRNTQSIEESVRHSDVVYNLVGRNYPTKNFSLEDVHVEGTERIAEAVAKYDVDRFIHVSSYNANLDSASEFYRTKARGEQVARSIYPETTIVRPAPVFGFEDNLLLKLASVMNLFTANNMQERFWPVHALELMLYDDSTAGQTYELYGPKNYSMAEIAGFVDREIFKKRRHINVPKKILQPVAGLLNKYLWWPIMSADEIEREFIDQEIDETAKTFKDLGIEPGDISKFTYHYLQGFRSGNFYDLPPATEKEKKEERKYLHVLDDQFPRFKLGPSADWLIAQAQAPKAFFFYTVLSSHALAALAEFNAEKDAHQERFEKLRAQAEANAAGDGVLSMEAFTEDWNESQFWYSDETANLIAGQLLEGADEGTTIAVVSAPSVFVALRNLMNARGKGHTLPKVVLLEHDTRFSVFPEFVFYDFQEPFKLPGELKGAVDRIVCDPPFLSEDCQTKAAMTVRWMMKPDAASKERVIVCTGERMESLVAKVYKAFGVKTTTYEPKHARGLSNEFYCYANFECQDWVWRATPK